MTERKLLSTHRTWQDWLGIVLALSIALAPWILDETAHRAAVVNAAVAGLVILLMAEIDLVSTRRWAEYALLAAGAWIAISPAVLGYGGALRVWHAAAGVLVMLLAALELWQTDRRPHG